MIDIRVSASALRAYLTCKRQLYYKITRAPRVDTAALIRGRVIHDMVEDLELGYTDVVSKAKSRLTKEFANPKILFRRGDTLTNALRLVDTCFNNYLSIRESLPILVKPEADFDFFVEEDVRFVGRFDQLRENNLIVELKTGRGWAPSQIFLAADIQATFYMWCYEHLFHQKPKFYYLHLSSGEGFELYRDKQDYDFLFNNIEEYIKDRRNENFPAERDGYRCEFCGYNATCIGDDIRSEPIFQVVGNDRPRKKRQPGNFALH